MLLSIETSCDETSVALFETASFLDNGSSILNSIKSHVISSQVDLHSLYGGVVPELASREHMTNLPLIVSNLIQEQGVKKFDLSGVAATTGPGLNGCLMVGLAYAKGLALSAGVPLFSVNHLEGHLLSSQIELSADKLDDLYPQLCLLVSGGNTEIVEIKGLGQYESLARTTDDAAGEAFDKIGVLLGLPYPGGALLSKLASDKTIANLSEELSFPQGMRNDMAKFSFSGMKTAVYRYVELHGGTEKVILNNDLRVNIARAAEEAIVSSLISKFRYWISERKPRSISLAGGVAANTLLRKKAEGISNEFACRLFIPSNIFCTDNAAMIGAVTLLKLRVQGIGSKDLRNISGEPNIGVKARWPISELGIRSCE